MEYIPKITAASILCVLVGVVVATEFNDKNPFVDNIPLAVSAVAAIIVAIGILAI